MSSGTAHLRVSLGEITDRLSEPETRGFTCAEWKRLEKICSRNRVKVERIDAFKVCEFSVLVRVEGKKKTAECPASVGG